MLRLGVDLGGTKTVVVVFNPSGFELFRRRVPTPRGDYRLALEGLAGLIREAERVAGAPCTVGIGIPGTFSRLDGRVKNAYNTVLNGQFVSGPGLSRELAASTGELVGPPEIAAHAERGNAACLAALARYEDRLARALAHVVNLLDPDTMVIGGGLSNITRLYGNVVSRLARYVYSDSVVTPVVPAAHGDASGVRGAAHLWA